jgi:2-C-methyl-D-erythritol 4-phosphate cytidylyltransferase
MNAGIVVAGGSGERFGRQGGKQLVPLAGRPMLCWALAAFEQATCIDTVVLTFARHGMEALGDELTRWGLSKIAVITAGGDTRQESVLAGLKAVPEEAEIVVVHDGARPLVRPSDIDACVAAVLTEGTDAAVLGRPAVDTIKRVRPDGIVTATLDRHELWQAETPQAFRAPALRRAHEEALAAGRAATDDAMLVEASGGTVRMVLASGPNLKVTLPADLALAASILAERGL